MIVEDLKSSSSVLILSYHFISPTFPMGHDKRHCDQTSHSCRMILMTYVRPLLTDSALHPTVHDPFLNRMSSSW